MPLRSACIRPTTAVCKPAARTAADCRRQSGVTTAAPANGGPRVRRAGNPHARAMPRTAWQSSPGAYRCHSYCSGCLSALSLLSAPSPAVGRLVASYPPGCVGLSPPGYTCTLTRFEVVKYVGVGLVGWWGRVVARPRPPRRAGATPIFMAAKRPRADGCDVARPPPPLCLWHGTRAGSGQWGGLCKRAGPQLKPPRL